ncbi:hypothetical protein [Alkalihalobacillus sp. AL-G]|uniref:hypothetical protein n=1 Tax=Alkalihalobacillus sp. AL-G TaxID=2926399 RepID=UPI00272CB3B1|nr:hypothetical protein [Alkalihalobacillus sp. AL-G]WLD94483.1 hypothetical protein MOJ78_06235 [Alkalihalobacillus sp. AL-G]
MPKNSNSSLFEKFSLYGKISNEELYLPIRKTPEFIAECNMRRLAIIGVEFYHLSGDKILPVTPISDIDLSDITNGVDDWQYALVECNKMVSKIINEKILGDDSLYCSFIVIDEKELRN